MLIIITLGMQLLTSGVAHSLTSLFILVAYSSTFSRTHLISALNVIYLQWK